MENLSLQEVEDFIQTNEFIIYGAGFISLRFYQCIKERNCEKNVECFAVTNKNGNESCIEGKMVREISEIERDKWIIIGTHMASVAQMQETLQSLGFTKFFCVYPYILELEYGAPVNLDRQINVVNFLRKMSHIYYPAVIYLVIEEYFGKNTVGYDLYLRMMEVFSSPEVAKKRLEALKKKISSYEIKNEYNIKVCIENGILIDGMHRIVFARYFDVKELKADLYHVSEERYFETMGKAMLLEENLSMWFSEKEIALIKAADNRLRGIVV